MKYLKRGMAAAAIVALTAVAQATPVFQGRVANGMASSTCTVSGSTKCASFYDSDLDITILNNWNIGVGTWSATAAAGSAQAMAELAGFSATGLTGWVLPTENGSGAGSGLNQFMSIRLDAGGSLAGLQAQFDGVQSGAYWSGSTYARSPNLAWDLNTVGGGQYTAGKSSTLYTVAVRPGDVAAAVPEPPTLALALAALGVTVVARRRRPA